MSEPTLSFIIPAYNAERTLPQSLAAGCVALPPPLEIILVDDGSTDRTAQIAESFGINVLSLGKNVGAATAKNRGAAAARGDILFFTDADIVMPSDAPALLRRALARPEVDGVVGLLDENIPYSNWASQFKNLWMNFTYARFAAADRIGLFYTSVAAMRRETFLHLGGFDENYVGASIAEDTEFGQRAWGAGKRIILEPALRVTHLKKYSVSGVLKEDFKRAYALTLMRLRKRGEPFFTSVPVFYQLAVPTVYLTVLAALGALVLSSACLSGAALVLLAIFYLLNASLLGFVLSKRGLLFALQSALFLPVDVFIVGLGMLRAFLDFARGRRY